MSREAHPKPFIRLPDGQSLLQKTLLRAAALPGVEEILTVTNRDYYFLTRDDYAQTGVAAKLAYLLEPTGRNTAPAIAAAALQIARTHGDDALMLVLSADHLIQDQREFAAAVNAARQLAADDWLVTFGIKPTHAETGYGYIEAGPALGTLGCKVARFVEAICGRGGRLRGFRPLLVELGHVLLQSRHRDSSPAPARAGCSVSHRNNVGEQRSEHRTAGARPDCLRRRPQHFHRLRPDGTG